MVIASGEGAEVAQAVEGDGIFRGAEPSRGSIARDSAISDIVGGLGPKQEPITPDDSVSRKRGALGISQYNDEIGEDGP